MLHLACNSEWIGDIVLASNINTMFILLFLFSNFYICVVAEVGLILIHSAPCSDMETVFEYSYIHIQHRFKKIVVTWHVFLLVQTSEIFWQNKYDKFTVLHCISQYKFWLKWGNVFITQCFCVMPLHISWLYSLDYKDGWILSALSTARSIGESR